MSITDVCWPYPKPKSTGYGRHREAYEAIRGPIPAGMDLDHVCHNRDKSCKGGVTCPHRACYNPWHLVPKPRSANLRAGRTYSPEVMSRIAAKNTIFYAQPEQKAILREQGARDAARRWATEDRSPIMCDDCGRGPFKGKSGMTVHRNRWHS